MADIAEHFLTSLYVHDAFAVKDLEIPIARGQDRRRHLLLTGPNGSGKSSILRALAEELAEHPLGPGQKRRHEVVPSAAVEARGLPDDLDVSKMLLAFMPASRALDLERPSGPSRIDERQFLHSQGAASMLLQFLVNLRTEQALAREDGDAAAADRIGQRFADFEVQLRQILDDDGARLLFDRSEWDFGIELSGGRRVEFETLPDGISGILYMWASLMIPAEAIRRAVVSDPPGWALVDEPELHLHARLQEMVLPFLTTMFPNVQLIVATHSPAVLASLPDATIFDLRSRKAIDSADLHGIRYGTILTEHFGIETDFDLATTRKLKRLKVLMDADPAPGTEEFDEMRAMARELSDVPHLLVAQCAAYRAPRLPRQVSLDALRSRC
ncbi:MAG: AAA family ATPase [Nannocystaceae bacterium]